MKILLIADPGIIIPPVGYGGIERIIADLAMEYTKQGHDVHILATKGSKIEGCILHYHSKEGFPPTKTSTIGAIFYSLYYLFINHSKFDVIHNFGRLLYLFPIKNKKVFKLQCYQRDITARNMKYIVSARHQNFYFSGCSQNLIDRATPPGIWKSIHNCVKFENYTFLKETNADTAPLVFLGRLDKIKGVHIAIEVAKKSQRNLIIAGNISNIQEEKEYFENEIKPHIDNKQIKYIGEVNDLQKNHILGSSAALLMPIQWNEPFGIVMIEAMACGTPVIAFPKGSVPEVIKNGINGYYVPDVLSMIETVKKLKNIDREICWNYAKVNFDVPIIAKKYLDLFNV